MTGCPAVLQVPPSARCRSAEDTQELRRLSLLRWAWRRLAIRPDYTSLAQAWVDAWCGRASPSRSDRPPARIMATV